MSLDSIKIKLLKTIQKHDGEWGWYKLERMIDPRELPDGSNVMTILKDLEIEGLIKMIATEPHSTFALTDLGREHVAAFP
jgi:hypothetical protein